MSIFAQPTTEDKLGPPILVSEAEAAALLSLSKPTFRRIVAAGHVAKVSLPGDLNLRRNLYRASDVAAFADSLSTS